MRESYFCQLQVNALNIAKKNPGPHIGKMQEILVNKQREETELESQLKKKKIKRDIVINYGAEHLTKKQ
jgi:hypothetical protein